jgi:hypothetical protein
VPSSDLASNGNLESVWVCGGSDTVLTYPDLTVTFEPGWRVPDGQSLWGAMVTDWRVGEVRQVGGQFAYVAGVTLVTPRGKLLFVVGGPWSGLSATAL